MYKWNLEVYRTSFARGLLVHGTELTIFWFFRVRYGTDPRSVHMAGEIGIRTHDGLSSPVLETGTLDRYATLLYDGAW